MSINRYLTRRDFLRTSGAALALSASLPGNLLAGTFKIPVLLYHDISDDFRGPYTMSPSTFAAQMEWLYSHGYKAISLRNLSELRERNIAKTVVITFDDGYASFMDYAFPLFVEYGFRVTINIIGQYVGTFMHLIKDRPMLSWDEYRYMSESGLVDLGCHTHSLHVGRGVLQLPGETLREDLRLFKKVFESEIGENTDILAWPFGKYDRRSMKIAKEAGFKYIVTSNKGYLSESTSLNEIPRLNIGRGLDFVAFKRHIGES